MEEYNSNEIRVLTLPEAVRKRPGMYFGDINYNGANNVVHELVANSIDLYLAGLSTKICVKIEKEVITVRDDGPGLAFWKKSKEDNNINFVQRYLTHRHDSPTADNHAPHIHLLGAGLGLAVVNSASSWLLVESSNGEKLWKQEFGRGHVTSDLSVKNTSSPKGTKIELTLDKELFGNNTVEMFELRKTMFEVAHFYPGIVIELQNERFCSDNGLLDLAYILYKRYSSFSQPQKKFYFNGRKDDVQIQVAAIGDSDDKTDYCSWVNGSESVKGGTHVEGLKRTFRKISWTPKVALIHLVMHDPSYAGLCKDALCNKEIVDLIDGMLSESIEIFGSEKR